MRTVGAELGAGYVVEGSARRAGDQLRVTAQLVETGTGAHLWSDSYDRRIEDVFAVQADLTAQIVASLVSHVSRSEAEAAGARPTKLLRAYDLVLKGRQHQYGPTTAEFYFGHATSSPSPLPSTRTMPRRTPISA